MLLSRRLQNREDIYYREDNDLDKLFSDHLNLLLISHYLIVKLDLNFAVLKGEGVLYTFLYGGVLVNIWGLRFYKKISLGTCDLQLKKNSIFRV